MTSDDRIQHLIRFYSILETLEKNIGGARKLAESSGRITWPQRGVYFFRESGEQRTNSGDGPRIVRVGTHALREGGKTRLWTRLSQHKGQKSTGGGNHRGSIFRLLVGYSLIERYDYEYPTWGDKNTATREIRTSDQALEREVSNVIGCMPFLWLTIEDDAGPESLRAYIEKNSISLLSNYKKTSVDPPSKNWLGHQCDRERVREAGLWNSDYVDKPYDLDFLDQLETLVSQTSHAGSFVIQCAATKRQSAGYLVSEGGRRVVFVAKPEAAPAHSARLYARPDDPSGNGKSWREVLIECNEQPGNNPLSLCPAWQLYENPTYERLVKTFGVTNVFILSAGWGLINASFLIPYYDITFSASAAEYKRRRKADQYRDFCMLPIDENSEIVFLGGRDYIPLFCSLTSAARNPKTVLFNSAFPPEARGCRLKKFSTSTRTNWHYECAKALIEGNTVI